MESSAALLTLLETYQSSLLGKNASPRNHFLQLFQNWQVDLRGEALFLRNINQNLNKHVDKNKNKNKKKKKKKKKKK